MRACCCGKVDLSVVCAKGRRFPGSVMLSFAVTLQRTIETLASVHGGGWTGHRERDRTLRQIARATSLVAERKQMLVLAKQLEEKATSQEAHGVQPGAKA
jgi:hypothetical protein